MLFIMVTTLVAVLKKEKDCTLEDNHVKVNVLQSYTLLWYILKSPYVQILGIILVTVKVNIVKIFMRILFIIRRCEIVHIPKKNQ